jgi:hypothetical protein
VRSSADARLAIAALLMAVVSLGASPVERQSLPANSEPPGPAEIARAIETVKADPNLATDRTIRTLRWKDSTTTARRSGIPAWLIWIAGLFRWLEQSARVLVWCAALVLAGLLVGFIVRLVRTHRVTHRAERFVVPTHVRDLDIRPESLPGDIGEAAHALWDRGEHRAALALLYRGMLSRLAHVHRIPIRDSSTEGECLTLAAAGLLTPSRREYASRLVGVWQRSVYGREAVQAATVYALCDQFASELDRVLPLDAIAPESAA